MNQSLIEFTILAGLLVLVPGLDTALIIRATLRASTKAAFATGLGISSGLFIWALLVTAGLTQLLTTYPTLNTVLEFIGAGYMGWLGIKLLKSSFGSSPGNVEEAEIPTATSNWSYFRVGLMTNLLNPKAAAFYIAVLPPFIPSTMSLIAGGLTLAAIHAVETMLWFVVLILAGAAIRPWLAKPQTSRWIDRITGVALIGFGLRILVT